MKVRHRIRRLLGRRVVGDSRYAAKRMHRELKTELKNNQKEGSEKEEDGGDKRMAAAAEVNVTSSELRGGGFIDPNC